ncbi:MAG: hypothetical protein R3B99_16075 [Polyangiales bacterium]
MRARLSILARRRVSEGVIAYEMLTGRMPLPIEDVPSLFDVHLPRAR